MINTLKNTQCRQGMGLAALAVAGLLSLSGCSLLGTPRATSTTTTSSLSATQAASTLVGGVCIDSTGSTPGPFAADARELVASTLETWAAPQGAAKVAMSPRPGLRLHVRQIETNSYKAAQPDLSLAISSTPGLSAEPSVTDPNFATKDQAWVAGRDEVARSRGASDASAAEAAGAVRGMPLLTTQDSDIAGCMSALAEETSGPRRLAIFSDLEQNVTPNLAGDLTGASILFVQPCNGSASTCSSLKDLWTSVARRAGATSVTFVRPEVSRDAFPDFLRGGA